MIEQEKKTRPNTAVIWLHIFWPYRYYWKCLAKRKVNFDVLHFSKYIKQIYLKRCGTLTWKQNTFPKCFVSKIFIVSIIIIKITLLEYALKFLLICKKTAPRLGFFLIVRISTKQLWLIILNMCVKYFATFKSKQPNLARRIFMLRFLYWFGNF